MMLLFAMMPVVAATLMLRGYIYHSDATNAARRLRCRAAVEGVYMRYRAMLRRCAPCERCDMSLIAIVHHALRL